MVKRSPLWRAGKFILDFFEIYLPVATFSTMFVVFVMSIFFRYVLNAPLTWPYELTIFMFIWTIMFGAGYAKREGTHVVFSVVYDRLPPQKQRISRIVAESVVLVAFIIAFWPSTSYILFWKTLKSPALRVSFDIVFAPYIVFMILMIGRSAYNLYGEIKEISRKEVTR
jgi:TRAP-type C4-dicarboxylate transport system permease small subunit